MRYRGLKKNTAQLFTLFALFALSNLWMVRSKLMEAGAWVRLQTGRYPQRL
jgi:transposase, IS5 family